jgi:hypothetical protein
MSFEFLICTDHLSSIFFINIICIVTTVAKYHSHTNLVIDTMTTKHHSHNLGHPHRSAKYHCNISLATNTIVTNYLLFLSQSLSHCVYPIHTEVCYIITSIPGYHG